MDTTDNLGLPYITASQAQKHVTHNEAIRALDAIVQLSVLDRDVATPPASPNEGDRYIVAASATGAWAGMENRIAAWQDGVWMFYAPLAGWLAWAVDEEQLYAWSGTTWSIVSGSGQQSFPILGINATADTTNRLSVSAPATLFNNEGAGHQVKINKNVLDDTASMLFQTGLSGRAEFGTTGDDDWHVKTSPDGSVWNEALIADKDSGAVRFPAGLEHATTRASVGQLLFAGGGVGVDSFYRIDAARGQNPRTAIISSVSLDVITLTTTDAFQFFTNTYMDGVSYVRIWNTSKSPEQSAWVKYQTANNQLQVLDSADISGWAATETIQIGDPTSVTPGRVIALDISPMLQQIYGAVFRQKGIFCKASIIPASGLSQSIDISPTGASGSFLGNNSDINGISSSALLFIPCAQLSPISNSNLVMIRENDGGGSLGVALLSALAVFG